MKIRKMLDTDRAFVIDSWLATFRSSKGTGPIPSSLYMPVYSEVLGAILSNPQVETLVAYDPDAEVGFENYGYLVHQTGQRHPVVHWCYTREILRGNGVLRALLQEAKIDLKKTMYYTFYCAIAGEFCNKYGRIFVDVNIVKRINKEKGKQHDTNTKREVGSVAKQ